MSRDIRGGFFLGGVFRKALRDSRTGFLASAGFGVVLVVVAGVATREAFGSPLTRLGVVAMARDLGPVINAIYGAPLDLTAEGSVTLGALFAWRYGGILMPMMAVWSILALSGTLASEARSGSLEFLAATPMARVHIALRKLAAHIVLVGIVSGLVAAALVYAGATFGTLPGDAIAPLAAVGYALLVGTTTLAAGGIAFALAPFVGRGAAAGVAATAMLAMYFANGFRGAVDGLGSVAFLSWYGWAAEHRPLAGMYAWEPLAGIAAAAIALFAVGVTGFAVRDLNSTIRVRTPRLPGFLVGLRGPARRSFGERLPAALWWGLGTAAYAALMIAVGPQVGKAVSENRQIVEMMAVAFPGLDLTTSAGLLQLLFVSFGVVLFGFAGAFLAGGWASDEGSGRLEMVLASPVARFRWAALSGLGVFGAIVVMTALVSGAIGLGSASPGADVATPMAGVVVLGLYGAAIAGIGFAVGGTWRSPMAAPVAGLYVVIAFLLQILVPALRWPGILGELALGTHLGEPMIGRFDGPGIVLCLVVAVGGLLLGAAGMARRDLER